MDRMIGIDYGRKRVGVAMSDPLGIFASPVDTVQTANIIDYLKTLAKTYPIKCFVVGYPINLDGTPSEALKDVQGFIAKLLKAFPGISVEKEDERFTSVLAHRSMIDSGMKKSDRRDKNSVDKISASFILQTYMDRQANASPDAATVPSPEEGGDKKSKTDGGSNGGGSNDKTDCAEGDKKL